MTEFHDVLIKALCYKKYNHTMKNRSSFPFMSRPVSEFSSWFSNIFAFLFFSGNEQVPPSLT